MRLVRLRSSKYRSMVPPWQLVLPDDQIFDTRIETFSVEVPEAASKPIVSIRATDAVGLTSSAEIELR